MLNISFNYIRRVLEALSFPGRCYSCEIEWHPGTGFICSNCWDSLQKAPVKLGDKFSQIDAPVSIIYRYTPLMRTIIHQMKFLGRLDIAERLGHYAGIIYRKLRLDIKYEAIVPVPLHPTRIRERGYDQNLAIARAFAKHGGVKVYEDLIIRLKNTKPQSRLSDIERSSNLKDAFSPNHSFQSRLPDSVLLIDDVIHSGSTVS